MSLCQYIRKCNSRNNKFRRWNLVEGKKLIVSPIDVIYYYVIWTDNESTLSEGNTRRQEGKFPVIKVLQGCISQLLHSVNSVLILYRTANMQSAIPLSFITSSSLLPCGLQSTHPPMSCYISPYVVYNIYGFPSVLQQLMSQVLTFNFLCSKKSYFYLALQE